MRTRDTIKSNGNADQVYWLWTKHGVIQIVIGKRGYRVRLNGADHQWGKDPPKEVVG
jgi:hypothetical protein